MLQTLTRKVTAWLRRAGAAGPAGNARAAPGDETGSERARRDCESGEAHLAAGRAAQALVAFEAAAATSPGYARAHDQAGLALQALGRTDQALACFRRALDARYDYVPALCHEGTALLELGRHDDAEDSFKLAVSHDPRSAEANFGLAMACWNRQRPDAAIGYLQRVVALDPERADAHVILGGLLLSANRPEDADATFRRAVSARPDVPELYLNWGLTLVKLGRIDDAAARFERASMLRPDFAEAHFNLGNARRAQGRGDDALACYERAAALQPDYADAYVGLGSMLNDRGEIARALECYRRAQSLDPGSIEAQHNMGAAYNQLGNVREAIACYEAAQAIRPGHPASLLNLAISWLEAGEFRRGWEAYECRFRQTNAAAGARMREFPWPAWRGESLAGKRILVWGEQGLGDEILFATLFHEVVAAARGCVIECVPKLVPLFTRSFPGARVVARTDPPHPDTGVTFDYQCAAGSLARWLRPDLGSFPARGGHLVAAPERVASWKSRLEKLGTGLKVGFSWRSVNLQGDRALACTRLDQWGAIFAVPGVHFVCLQYDDCEPELADARSRFGVALHRFPDVDLFNDIDEAAALTRAVDLVVTGPTTVSLLAAAVGVPTWQMSYGADWQMHGTDRNPWLPAITLFRRAWNERWETVLDAIATRLRDLASRPSAGAGAESEDLARGESFLLENRLMEARAQFELHLARAPHSPRAWLGLARSLRGLDRPQQAAEACARALELDAGLSAAALELGIVRYQQGRFDEAETVFGRILDAEPRHVAARVNRALALYHRGDVDAAVAGYEGVLADRPDLADVRMNLGLALLARGDLVRGWTEYEWRFDQATAEDRDRSFPFPRWRGEDLDGKTVLVWKEQSVGAQILFAGMLSELIARAGFCVIECTDKLVPLFARSFPDADVVPRTHPPHPYTQQAIDFQVPMGGIARWLRRSIADYPERAAYLTADPDRVEYWRTLLNALAPGPKIGFSWRSINVSAERSLACTLIEQWKPVLKLPGATFVCLQYDDCSEELERFRRETGIAIHTLPDVDMFNDLDEVSALMRALDLVISAPTAVSVLSAALGVTTWQLHHGTDWQTHGTGRHMWLRSVRRFERGVYQPWDEVMEAVADELARWLAARGRAGG